MTLIASGRASSARRSEKLDFAAINRAALRRLPDLVERWLPGGHQVGREYSVKNPRRGDRNEGSFKINTSTGKWGDFATGVKGGDPVSLAAYLFDLRQVEAARKLAAMLGLEGGSIG